MMRMSGRELGARFVVHGVRTILPECLGNCVDACAHVARHWCDRVVVPHRHPEVAQSFLSRLFERQLVTACMNFVRTRGELERQLEIRSRTTEWSDHGDVRPGQDSADAVTARRYE